jgi:hypothetical protein
MILPHCRPASRTGEAGTGSLRGGVTDTDTQSQPVEVVLVVDIANVMGSRPDGWWRDRAGAATHLLNLLGAVKGTTVPGGQDTVQILDVRAVVEGAAKHAEGPVRVSVLRAETDGDAEIVAEARRLTGAGKAPMVVTADRGLRARLPVRAIVVGPGWLNRLLGR